VYSRATTSAIADRCGLAAAFDFDDIFVVGGNADLVDVALLNLKCCRLLVVCGLMKFGRSRRQSALARSRGTSGSRHVPSHGERSRFGAGAKIFRLRLGIIASSETNQATP